MKKEIIEVEQVSFVGYMATVKFSPNWLEKLFRVQPYSEKYFSEYGIVWHYVDTGKELSYLLQGSLIKLLSKIYKSQNTDRVLQQISRFRKNSEKKI